MKGSVKVGKASHLNVLGLRGNSEEAMDKSYSILTGATIVRSTQRSPIVNSAQSDTPNGVDHLMIGPELTGNHSPDLIDRLKSELADRAQIAR